MPELSESPPVACDSNGKSPCTLGVTQFVRPLWKQLILLVVVLISACGTSRNQAGRVEGHVRWSNCNVGVCIPTPWTRTPVRFRSTGQADSVVISADDGSYTISLRPGMYSIILPQTVLKGPATVTVISGQTRTIDFLLHKPGG